MENQNLISAWREIEDILSPLSTHPKGWDKNTKARLIYGIRGALEKVVELRLAIAKQEKN